MVGVLLKPYRTLQEVAIAYTHFEGGDSMLLSWVVGRKRKVENTGGVFRREYYSYRTATGE